MKKIIILLLSVFSFLYINKNIRLEENIIPDSAIRFRVIANSNTIYDQNIKIQIRNLIQNHIFSLIKDSKSIEETRKIIMEHKEEFDNLISEKLSELNYDKDYEVNYGINYFPEKKYKGVVYKEGNYESLVVKLGKGEGNNFWCVLFPPLCLIEADDNNVNDVEYKFFIKELIDKFFKN